MLANGNGGGNAAGAGAGANGSYGGGSGSGVQEVVPTWTNVVEGGGCTLVRDGGALEKRGGEWGSWDTGAFSNEAITRKEGGSESQGLKWRAATADKQYELGLSHEDGGVERPSKSKKDFGMFCDGVGCLRIYEQGSQVQGSGYNGSFGGYKAGEPLKKLVHLAPRF